MVIFKYRRRHTKLENEITKSGRESRTLIINELPVTRRHTHWQDFWKQCSIFGQDTLGKPHVSASVEVLKLCDQVWLLMYT